MKIINTVKDELKVIAFSIVIVPVCLVFRIYRRYFRKKRRFRNDWSDYENY